MPEIKRTAKIMTHDKHGFSHSDSSIVCKGAHNTDSTIEFKLIYHLHIYCVLFMEDRG
jgi:hypothetical protein